MWCWLCVVGDMTLFAASPDNIYIIATVCHLSFWNVTLIKALSPAPTCLTSTSSQFYINTVTKWLKSHFSFAAKGTKSQTAINSDRLSLWYDCVMHWVSIFKLDMMLIKKWDYDDDYESGWLFQPLKKTTFLNANTKKFLVMMMMMMVMVVVAVVVTCALRVSAVGRGRDTSFPPKRAARPYWSSKTGFITVAGRRVCAALREGGGWV